MVSFVLTTGRRRWYVVGSYVPPNEAPDIVRMEEALGQAAKGLDIILMGDLNVRLQEMCDSLEE